MNFVFYLRPKLGDFEPQMPRKLVCSTNGQAKEIYHLFCPCKTVIELKNKNTIVDTGVRIDVPPDHVAIISNIQSDENKDSKIVCQRKALAAGCDHKIVLTIETENSTIVKGAVLASIEFFHIALPIEAKVIADHRATEKKMLEMQNDSAKLKFLALIAQEPFLNGISKYLGQMAVVHLLSLCHNKQRHYWFQNKLLVILEDWQQVCQSTHKNIKFDCYTEQFGDSLDFVDFSGTNVKHFCSCSWTRFNLAVKDFGHVTHFQSHSFNQPVSNFCHVTHFVCSAFNQPVQNFGSITHFECREFNQPVQNFENIQYFKCLSFNQPVNDFGNLKNFTAFFNQKLVSFNNLRRFKCRGFNSVVLDFKNLQIFICNEFNQPVANFGKLLRFDCEKFNQSVADFGSLRTFRCANFNQPITTFGKLRHFACADFNQPVKDFANLQYFYCFDFNHKIKDLGDLLFFWCWRYTHKIPNKKRDNCHIRVERREDRYDIDLISDKYSEMIVENDDGHYYADEMYHFMRRSWPK